jgi:hypothetical protein
MEENIEALDWELTTKQQEKINHIFSVDE